MISKNAERVARNTSDEANERIRRQTQANVARFATAGDEAIDQRLAELDREWDVERWVETLAPSLTLFGLFMGVASGRRGWLVLPVAVQGFFLQHALQGWCPPVPVLRGLGVRTMSEINEERMALKALRGDFRDLTTAPEVESEHQVSAALAAVRR